MFPENKFKADTVDRLNASKPDISEATKTIIKQWCADMKQKHGDDWKAIVAKEMTDEIAPHLQQLLSRKKAS